MFLVLFLFLQGEPMNDIDYIEPIYAVDDEIPPKPDDPKPPKPPEFYV